MKGAHKSTLTREVLLIRDEQEVNAQIQQLRLAADRAHQWIAQQSAEPLEFLRQVKFQKKGFHPITHQEINLIEQVNQTWTYLVALTATKLLLKWHPDAEGFRLAPGATASQELDIMSVKSGLVGAETFAATSPRSNNKIGKDLKKMSFRNEDHRYVFFASPLHPLTERLLKYEVPDVAVWSIEI